MMHIVPPEEIPLAKDVPTDNLMAVYKICLQMENLCLLQNGIGLNAVQVGIPWNLFIVRQPNNDFDYYINIVYEPIGEEKSPGIEGCLSLRTKEGLLRYFDVERYKRVRVKGHKLVVKPSLVAGLEEVSSPSISTVPVDFIVDDGIYNIVFQHEADHSSQILISDLGTEIELRR